MSGNSRNRGGNFPLRRVEEDPENEQFIPPEDIEAMRRLANSGPGRIDPGYAGYLRFLIARSEGRYHPAAVPGDAPEYDDALSDGSVYSGTAAYEQQVFPVYSESETETLSGGRKKASGKKKGGCSSGASAPKNPFGENDDDDVGSSKGRRLRTRAQPSRRYN